MGANGAASSPSPRASSTSPRAPSARGEGRGEGQSHTPTSASVAAPHPNPLPASGERERVGAIIPCLDEEAAIGRCVAAVLACGVGEVIVVDGQSTDRTAERAAAAGAKVIVEPVRGYGQAMLSGLAALSPGSTIVLFIDGDGSDRPELIPAVLEPIESGRADFVLGSRLKGERQAGSLGASQIVAGHLAGVLVRAFYGVRFTDMSPFRAIRRDALESLDMAERSFGWNLEMQMRVAAAGMRAVEVPVGQRRRVGGVSKVSGDWRNAARAAFVLVTSFWRLAWQLRRDAGSHRRVQ